MIELPCYKLSPTTVAFDTLLFPTNQFLTFKDIANAFKYLAGGGNLQLILHKNEE